VARISGKEVVRIFGTRINGVHSCFTSLDESLTERLREEFPEAHFVKAFNQVNDGYMVNPNYKCWEERTSSLPGTHVARQYSVCSTKGNGRARMQMSTSDAVGMAGLTLGSG
jgi:hypothetical protein